MRALSRRRRCWAMAGVAGLAVLAVGPLPARAATGEVRVVAGGFEPPTVTIKPGDKVRWTNDDDAKHRVKQDSDSAEKWDTGDLDKDESQTHTFPSAGRFGYHCEIHPQMTGMVEVEDEVRTTTTTAPPTTTTTAPPPPATTTTAPPATTTTAPATATTDPPSTTTTARPASAAQDPTTTTTARPATTTTTAAPTTTTTAPATTTTLAPTTTSAAPTTAPPAAPPPSGNATPSLGSARPDAGPVGKAASSSKGDVSVATDQAASVRPSGGDGIDWGVYLAILALLVSAGFGMWSLWALRPSRI